MKRNKTYISATIVCICGETVKDVPPKPDTKTCPKCGVKLNFTTAPGGVCTPWVRFPDSRKRTPGQRTPRIVAAKADR